MKIGNSWLSATSADPVPFLEKKISRVPWLILRRRSHCSVSSLHFALFGEKKGSYKYCKELSHFKMEHFLKSF